MRARRRRGSGKDVGDHDPPEDGELRGAERTRRLLHLRVELVEHGLDGPDDERQRHEEEREDIAVRENATSTPTGDAGP